MSLATIVLSYAISSSARPAMIGWSRMEPKARRRPHREEAIVESNYKKAMARMDKAEARSARNDARFEKWFKGMEKLAKIGQKETAELRRMHRKTDKKMKALIRSQKRTDKSFYALADAQKLTAEKLKELADAQKLTEVSLRRFLDSRGKSSNSH